MTDDGFTYSYEGEDSHGLPIWCCYRTHSGICGYGPTQEAALEDFLDKEETYLPKPRAGRVIHSSPFEPPTYAEEHYDHDEE